MKIKIDPKVMSTLILSSDYTYQWRSKTIHLQDVLAGRLQKKGIPLSATSISHIAITILSS